MIKLLHTICKFGMALWTFLCGFIGICYLIGMNKLPPIKGEDPTIAATGSIIGFMILVTIWFFPTITMAIGAYFTRPQAWEDNKQPQPVVPLAEG